MPDDRAVGVVRGDHADRVARVARVDLDERAGVDRAVAGRDDADHDVGRDLVDREERVARLALRLALGRVVGRAVELAGDADLLGAVRVDDADLHVVRRGEVLPLREADAAVVAQERRHRVRQVLREVVAVGVAAGDADGRELQRGARVLVLVGARAHRRVHLVGDERDEPTREVDGVDVVVVAVGLLVNLVLAVGARRQLHRVDVVVVVRVPLHREDRLRGVERHVGAVEVGQRERRGEAGHGARRARGRQQVEAAARLVALVVEDLAVAARDVDRVGPVGVLDGGLPLDEEQRLDSDPARRRPRRRRVAAGPHARNDSGQPEHSQRLDVAFHGDSLRLGKARGEPRGERHAFQ